MMGWGLTSEDGLKQQHRLRYGTVPVVSDSTCARRYRDERISSDMICAGDPRNGGWTPARATPVARWSAGTGRGWTQVGIVSWGFGCGRAGYPGVYARVSKFESAIGGSARAALSGGRGCPRLVPMCVA